MLVEFYGLRFDLPSGWEDITDDLPEGAPPSLARPEGVGAIQFTFAKYQGGEQPEITIATLRNFLEDFFVKNRLPHDNITDHDGGVMSVEGISISDGDFLLARYFSNGRDVALVTYVADDVTEHAIKVNLEGVQTIMNSMEF